MFRGILGKARILLNSFKTVLEKVEEAFASSTIPPESERNLTCTHEERRYPFLSFLAQGIMHLLSLNHETVGLWYQLNLCATEEANAVKEKDSAVCNVE